MQTTQASSLERVHRLLFRALVEIRAEGHEHQNKLVFHLADLFHQCVLDLEAAAGGEVDYDTVFRRLEEKAEEMKLQRWLQSALADRESEVAADR